MTQKGLFTAKLERLEPNVKTPIFSKTAESWFKEIIFLNDQKKKVYGGQVLKYVFAEKWLSMCRLSASKIGRKAWTVLNSETENG